MISNASVAAIIAASPWALYTLVSDVTRMGEWSPECVGGEWVDGATGPVVGARFLGRNRSGEATWEADCEVVEADWGRAFAFRAGNQDGTAWRYTFEAVDGGTRVTESFDAPVMRQSPPPSFLRPTRGDDLLIAMATTLAQLRTVAEAEAAGAGTLRLDMAKDSIDLGIVCRDGAAMLEFYRDVIGFTHLASIPMPLGRKGTMHRLLCGSSVIKLVDTPEPPAASNPPGGMATATGMRYFTFFLNDMSTVLERCQAAGAPIRIPRTKVRPGVEIAMVEDPEGNWVELGEMR